MQLKLGDKIYFMSFGKYPDSYEKIIKVTPKMYKTKNYTLKVEDDYIRIIGQGIWIRTTAHLENPKLNALWEEAKIINWFDNRKFTTEEKVKIHDLFNKQINTTIASS